ncbi:MAG: HIT domain-containing protein [Pirellulales bacterium]|nr:HIT domain-containing protein [Pirellulales bacterium]
MSHEQLWAPWRLAYIQGADAGADETRPERHFLPGADESCFLCRAVAEGASRAAANLVVEQGSAVITILNRYPYNNGHLLVAPLAHKGQLDELTDEEHLACMRTLGRMVTAIRARMRAEGFNVGLNLGRTAGAGLPGHLHWHIVPRWNGDTNFMPVLAGVKVIPQSLEALRELLADAGQP